MSTYLTKPDAVLFLRLLWAMDSMLVALGFPPISPWWRGELTRYITALFDHRCRSWIVRVGRRGGKSSTLCRLAVAWWLYGLWHVAPGDIAVIAFVSVSKDESASRLRTIAALLDALKVKYVPRDGELEVIPGPGQRAVIFKTFACTVRSVVGFTSIMIVCDEMARWESRDVSANPAREVVGSLRPTAATVPYAPFVAVSSPWGVDDYHHELFELGEYGEGQHDAA